MKCDKCLFCNSLSAITGLDTTGVYGIWISRAIAVIHQLCDQTDLIPRFPEIELNKEAEE